jgi:hypothetical protein
MKAKKSRVSARRGPERGRPLVGRLDPAAQERRLLRVHLAPAVLVDAEEVAARARLAGADEHPDPRQVVHGARDGGGADIEPLGDLGRRELTGVLGEHAREHPGGHARHAAVHEQRREALDEAIDVLGHVSVSLHNFQNFVKTM